MNAKLLELRVRGLRSLADVSLPLSGLTVLIGENGAGKSSLIEAFQMARLVAGPEGFERLGMHNLGAAVRADSGELKLDMRVAAAGRNFAYSITIDGQSRSAIFEAIHELEPGVALCDATVGTNARALITRSPEGLCLVEESKQLQISPRQYLFDYFGVRPPEEYVGFVRAALAGIDVQLSFAVTSGWANRMASTGPSPREPQVLEPTERLHLFGRNLANAYHSLKNNGSQRWQTTLELLRLGLGPDLLDVQTPTAGGGYVNLAVEFAGVGQITAFQLSDGQLAYLAFVALVQLDPGRSVLCFDEPEQHLHPALLARVLQLFEEASTQHPVVIATHSDRLLDYLSDPVGSVLVCELDAERRTTLRRLDQTQLDTWLKHYGGVGEIRAGGQLDSVLAEQDA